MTERAVPLSSPRVYLAIDNCFASKRWTQPREWMEVIRELGLTCVEASADNECDPLYAGPEVLADWCEEVREGSHDTGVRVVNLYSGHGTYATLGLAHPDVRVRDRILHQWLKPMVATAAQLNAGLGFFCHAFADAVLQDGDAYRAARADLVERLAEVSRFAAEFRMTGCVGVEQMYSPHQIPWTIAGAEDLLRDVFTCSGAPFHLTIDVGHQCGQRRFRRPDAAAIGERLRTCRKGGSPQARPPVDPSGGGRACGEPRDGLWLGPRAAFAAFDRAVAAAAVEADTHIREILDLMAASPHFFSTDERDADPYAWLERLGPWSPIVHLQQTDGTRSAHAPFTAEHNRAGIIRPAQVLRALQRGYWRDRPAGMPPPVDVIYLTLEPFTGTADINTDVRRRLKESVAYWRAVVPEDGLTLDEILDKVTTQDAG
jgi:sugar phosphate isomerase/epimerase